MLGFGDGADLRRHTEYLGVTARPRASGKCGGICSPLPLERPPVVGEKPSGEAPRYPARDASRGFTCPDAVPSTRLISNIDDDAPPGMTADPETDVRNHGQPYRQSPSEGSRRGGIYRTSLGRTSIGGAIGWSVGGMASRISEMPQGMRRYAQRLRRLARSDDGIAPNIAGPPMRPSERVLAGPSPSSSGRWTVHKLSRCRGPPRTRRPTGRLYVPLSLRTGV